MLTAFSLYDFRTELEELRGIRRRNLTDEQKLSLEQIPQNVRLLEEEKDTVVQELGGEEFRNIDDATCISHNASCRNLLHFLSFVSKLISIVFYLFHFCSIQAL